MTAVFFRREAFFYRLMLVALMKNAAAEAEDTLVQLLILFSQQAVPASERLAPCGAGAVANTDPNKEDQGYAYKP